MGSPEVGKVYLYVWPFLWISFVVEARKYSKGFVCFVHYEIQQIRKSSDFNSPDFFISNPQKGFLF